jgi:Peptidase family M1 domain
MNILSRLPVTLALVLTLAPTLSSIQVFAQQSRPIPYPVIPDVRFESAVERGTRSENGQPGENYWMNAADYTIDAVLYPDTREVRGSETVSYLNNSPNTIDRLVFHLRQNLHAEGAVRNRPQKLTGGFQINSAAVNGQAVSESTGRDDPGYRINGTVMTIPLATPLEPGERISASFDWEFEVPEAGAPRIGTDGEMFFVGYWYPQLAMYDDLEGWRADQYFGNGEFYMGLASYDVSLTLPEGWLVGATGTLQNSQEVLSDRTRERLNTASTSHEPVSIVGADERGAGSATQDSPDGRLTWRFFAENVRDFAFGTSDNYVWDATNADVGGGEMAMINAFYRPDREVWKRSAEYLQYTIEYLSKMFAPYPWAHMTSIEGVVGGGMEFPMLTHIGGARNDQGLFGVTFHETAHMYFPMIVGQNEKAFSWMDEGLTSYNTAEGSTDFWSQNSWDPDRQSYYRIAGTGDEVEPMRHGDQYPYGTAARGIASYNKPAVALNALRGIVGQERLMEAYREYFSRWAFKHPQPYDLFNTFNDVLGEDLDWFWTTMFFNTWTLDQSIVSVTDGASGVTVRIDDLGLSPFPVPVRVTYGDGTVVDEVASVDEWLSGKRSIELNFEAGTIIRVEIDPGQYLPDVDRSNNVWTK